ncbi:hypothetical protein VKT23_019175 [Stygiomarasmius scandens]|uniref:Uncharacterized protein n=1 Tax=Marasmiellus scandens TaxID=2682957 RepID=A0ABR1INL4_9AGAR
MELFVLRRILRQDRYAVILGVLQSAAQKFEEKLAVCEANKISLTVWAHSTDDVEHYTIRAYNDDGKVAGSIHVGVSGETEGWFGSEMKESRGRKSGTGAGFNPDKHVCITPQI